MCVEETLQQSFVSYVAVWTECHAAASVRRRFRARLVPAAEDSYEEREICQFQNYNLRVHKVCRVAGTLVQCCPQRREHS